MKWRRLLSLAVLLGVALFVYMYTVAFRDPVVRRLDVPIAAWSADSAPVTIALLSDMHVAGPDMPPGRLARIVRQVNALHPDIVLLAGDFVSDKALATHYYSAAEVVAPLAGLRARLGVAAVMGNHDHWREDDLHESGIFQAALAKAGIILLDNQVERLGPVVLGGVDDIFTGHADVPATLAAMHQVQVRRPGGTPLAKVVVSHSPDIFPELPAASDAAGALLVLAGHTHCGQIAPPGIGPILTASNYGKRYACGVVHERGNTLVVGAGLGTSVLPLRLGAVPDMWLITLKPGR